MKKKNFIEIILSGAIEWNYYRMLKTNNRQTYQASFIKLWDFKNSIY